MSTTVLPNPALITNLVDNIKPKKFVSQSELNSVIGALLHDISTILTTNHGVKTQSRRSNNQTFSLQEFANTDDVELLITYFSNDYSGDINRCSNDQIKIDYNFYYRIEGKEGNQKKLENLLGIIEQLIVYNYNNAQFWKYQLTTDPFNSKEFISCLGGYNKLIDQDIVYQNVQSKNYYTAKQTFSLNFAFKSI
jgi:hypothetical protein